MPRGGVEKKITEKIVSKKRRDKISGQRCSQKREEGNLENWFLRRETRHSYLFFSDE